jgi:hypothetical protein
MITEPQYLGDGVYVQNDDRDVVLTTGTNEIEKADNVIYLEKEVLAQFLIWLKENKA